MDSENPHSSPGSTSGRHFIQQIIDADLREGRVKGEIVTRFPPEPNGYLHIGHGVRPLWLNFSIAAEYGGRCHLRFDDTNPETEDMKYVEAIKKDIRWLGYDWADHLYFASDYFEQLYEFALKLITDGKAYVDSLSEEEIREYRGTVTESGKNSPHRKRSVDENLDLFKRMRAGEFPDGSHVLRAKIDMASPNMLMRDPVLYRIKHADHYRRGSEFPIYPMYDFAHPLSDAIEGITHSLCSLEFEVHRPLYDWLVDAVFDPPRPHQYEFARFNMDYTVMSKRKLLHLVEKGHVAGWDDPRMPTIAGLRRRGVTPEALRNLAEMIGIAKGDTRVDYSILEYAIRDDLNERAPRVMCVLRPLKVVLTNFPDDEVEWANASYWPHDIPKEGSRPIPLTREIYIEQEDFMENPPAKYHRLAPGSEVRLRYGYVIRCDEVVKNEAGEVEELRCTYDPETKSGSGSKRRVKGTVHWVSASEGIPVDVRLYDRLMSVPDPDDVEEGQTFEVHLNPDSLIELRGCIAEPSLKSASPGERYQFERQGYFYLDPEDKPGDRLVFNRTITLRDTWNRPEEAQEVVSRDESNRPDGDAATRPGPPATADATPRDPLEDLGPVERQRADSLASQYGLPAEDAAILGADAAWHAFFVKAAAEAAGEAEPTAIANWLIHEMRPAIGDDSPAGSKIKPGQISVLVTLLSDNTISSRIAKDVFAEMIRKQADPLQIIEEKGLSQISDPDQIRSVVDAVLEAFPDRVAAYRGGKTGLMGFFVGQAMSRTSGKANPQVVKEILADLLD